MWSSVLHPLNLDFPQWIVEEVWLPRLIMWSFLRWFLGTLFLKEASCHWEKSSSQRLPCCEKPQASTVEKLCGRDAKSAPAYLAIPAKVPGPRVNKPSGVQHSGELRNSTHARIEPSDIRSQSGPPAISLASSHSWWGYSPGTKSSHLCWAPPTFLTTKFWV